MKLNKNFNRFQLNFYNCRDAEKIKQEKRKRKHRFASTVTGDVRNSNIHHSNFPNKLAKMIPSSRSLTISEFDSGMPAPKKRKH